MHLYAVVKVIFFVLHLALVFRVSCYHVVQRLSLILNFSVTCVSGTRVPTGKLVLFKFCLAEVFIATGKGLFHSSLLLLEQPSTYFVV